MKSQSIVYYLSSFFAIGELYIKTITNSSFILQTKNLNYYENSTLVAVSFACTINGTPLWLQPGYHAAAHTESWRSCHSKCWHLKNHSELLTAVGKRQTCLGRACPLWLDKARLWKQS